MGVETASNFAQGNSQAGKITVQGFGYELFNNNVVDDGNFQLTFAGGKNTPGKKTPKSTPKRRLQTVGF